MKKMEEFSLVIRLLTILGIGMFLVPMVAPISWAGDADEILKEVNKLKNQSSDFRVELKTVGDKENYKIGDEIRFSFKTNKECYITLINIGPSGKPTILFPNSWTKTNLVKAGVEYFIPPMDSNYFMEAKEPLGIEVVKAVASLKPIESLAGASMKSEGNFKVINEPGLVMKGIGMEMGRRERTDWSTADAVFSIEPSRR